MRYLSTLCCHVALKWGTFLPYVVKMMRYLSTLCCTMRATFLPYVACWTVYLHCIHWCHPMDSLELLNHTKHSSIQLFISPIECHKPWDSRKIGVEGSSRPSGWRLPPATGRVLAKKKKIKGNHENWSFSFVFSSKIAQKVWNSLKKTLGKAYFWQHRVERYLIIG